MSFPKALIFDVGGVLVSSPVVRLQEYSKKLGLQENSVGVRMGRSAAFHQLETGEITLDDFTRAIKQVIPEGDGEAIRACFTGLKLHRDLLMAIKSIRDTFPTLKTAVITNNFLDRGSVALRQTLEPLFDVFVESHQERVRKPHRRIYEICCERLGVSPSDCVFIDDLGPNLKAAAALGMRTIKVSNNDTAKLIATLAKMLEWDAGKAFYPPGASPSGIPERHRLDMTSLLNYLSKELPGRFTPQTSVVMHHFGRGQSNPTYYIRTPFNGEEYVLRKQPNGKLLKGAHSMHREYQVISALGKYTDVPVPETHLLCTDLRVIGTEFYLMSYVHGRILKGHDELAKLPKYHRQEIYADAVRTLAKLHKVPYRAIGLGGFGKEGNYFRRAVGTWEKQYRGAVERDGHPGAPPIPELEKLAEVLRSLVTTNLESAVSLIHGDYKLDNMIIHPTEPRVIALLDFELSTIGSPYNDVGYFIMFHHIKKVLGGVGGERNLEKMNLMKDTEVLEYYAELMGHPAPVSKAERSFLLAFSLFKLSAIAHGVWSRGIRGNASNAATPEQIAAVGAASRGLARQGLEVALKSSKL